MNSLNSSVFLEYVDDVLVLLLAPLTSLLPDSLFFLSRLFFFFFFLFSRLCIISLRRAACSSGDWGMSPLGSGVLVPFCGMCVSSCLLYFKAGELGPTASDDALF